ncbi:MAG TPA: hypothetical protein VIG51_06355 [Candidatus Baltobacteraceae bacterium]
MAALVLFLAACAGASHPRRAHPHSAATVTGNWHSPVPRAVRDRCNVPDPPELLDSIDVPFVPRALGFKFPSKSTIVCVSLAASGRVTGASLVQESGVKHADEFTLYQAEHSRYRSAQIHCKPRASTYLYVEDWPEAQRETR